MRTDRNTGTPVPTSATDTGAHLRRGTATPPRPARTGKGGTGGAKSPNAAKKGKR